MARAYTPIGWENGTKEAEAYVTISGVDYEVTPEQWDGNTPVDATNLDHMEKGIQNSYDVKLLAVTDTEPSECATGDIYYNTTNKLLYTATGTNTWSSTGTEPLEGILYIVFDEENNQGNSYSWNGTDLSSVGGGGGGSSDIIIVEPDEPTEETKLVIEEEDLDFQYQTGDTLPVGTEVDVPDDTTIPDGWVEVDAVEDFKSQVTNFEVGVNQTTVGKCYFKRQGKLINIIFQGASKQHSVNDVLFTLPAGYRPSDEVYFPFIKGSLNDGIAVINSNGNCSVAIVGTQSQNNRIYFAVSYFLD